MTGWPRLDEESAIDAAEEDVAVEAGANPSGSTMLNPGSMCRSLAVALRTRAGCSVYLRAREADVGYAILDDEWSPT